MHKEIRAVASGITVYLRIPAGIAVCLLNLVQAMAQQPPTDTTKKVEELHEVIFSFNKWEQQLNEVPNKITKINRAQVLFRQPQTAADMLAQGGSVFIQKSQLGGGSPMIRGFATNRVLLVMDGVRMNNAIYRSGNLQNVISIDPLALESSEVVFGPGSLIYGSDAIGGVMDFHSLEARFARDEKLLVKGSAMVRHATANQEKTIHADFNLAGRKMSWLSSVSFSSFDDLKMGRHGGQDRYLRTEYVERINGRDSIIKNADPRIQRFTGYDQLNILQKLRFRITDQLQLQYSFTYAGTGTAPRYDRLIQYRSGSLRFAEWNYGPMLWRMHTLHLAHNRKTALYDNARFTASYQNYAESRIDRTRGKTIRNKQAESVNALSFNWDASKTLGKAQLFWGAEYVHNKIGSKGWQTDIQNGTAAPAVSRYPDNSSWFSSGIYGSYKINFRPDWTFSSGIRYSYNGLDADFDKTYIPFPYESANLRDGAVTFNAGMVHRPTDNWQLNGNISTGYRMPNIDDIGKLFESAPGNITVPNPDLEPEYAWNFELGAVFTNPGEYSPENGLRLELNVFHTILDNAIVRRPASLNGMDSILFDGILSRVEALKNAAKATVWGLQAAAQVPVGRYFSARINANYITGRETDDNTDAAENAEKLPLRHAPPFYGNAAMVFTKGKWQLELNSFYNSAISNENLAPSEQSKTDIYALGSDGKPYAPDWYTVNLKTAYRFSKNLQAGLGWENMTNQRYRPYSSGLVAAGSNWIISLRASW
ncbi:TonB-dependent receptor plug domain-containing protein [Flavihumibacter stibioxidans]|uniref:Hemoglobin/transferrin/lactoferrin receptor protein n=1 Tax=Flavihumibacter stibioxidans TaxID=1834163 RepID=A0ABR7M7F8_9BACT|nr:TonB-dependent receptor [Flavihumibacter stibioxidans]MBC6490950.1 hypothetical protein [Flavihumibacter stibioxidans]